MLIIMGRIHKFNYSIYPFFASIYESPIISITLPPYNYHTRRERRKRRGRRVKRRRRGRRHRREGRKEGRREEGRGGGKMRKKRRRRTKKIRCSQRRRERKERGDLIYMYLQPVSTLSSVLVMQSSPSIKSSW